MPQESMRVITGTDEVQVTYEANKLIEEGWTKQSQSVSMLYGIEIHTINMKPPASHEASSE